MPKLEISSLNQKAVLYTLSRYDADGDVVLSNPVELSVRKELGSPLAINPIGATIEFDVALWVDQEITLGSVVWLGALADLPGVPTNLKEVVDYREMPDIKGRNFERIILLNAWNNTLPTVS